MSATLNLCLGNNMYSVVDTTMIDEPHTNGNDELFNYFVDLIQTNNTIY